MDLNNTKKIVIFASGSGSNAENITTYFKHNKLINIELIISNKENSGVLDRAKKLGIVDFDKKYNIDEMVKGDVIFCATGVTSGDLAKGVADLGNEYRVTTFALHKSQKVIKTISNIYNK